MDKPVHPPLSGGALLAGTILLSLGNFLVVLDTTISNVSIPTISGDLGVSTTEGTWVITSYAIAEAITIPLTGWLAQRYGQVRLFVASVTGFTLMSALCGLASNLELLVFFRFLQGLAGGPLIPMSSTLLLSIFPRSKSSIALALWGMTTVVAPIAGPLLGGLICDNWHWSLIFWINVPLGIVVAIATWALLRTRETATTKKPIDVGGLVLLVLFVLSFQVMLDKGRELDWFDSLFIVGCAVTAVLSLVLFVIWEVTEKNPVVDLTVIASRTWVASTVALALLFGLFIGNIVITPLWLQSVMTYTATWAGFATAPMGILSVLTAPLVGRLLPKLDPRLIVTFGVSTLALSFFMRSHLNTDATFMDIVTPIFIIGAGVPAFIIPLTALGVSDLPASRQAAGSGLQNFLRILALAIGSSLSQTYWDHATRHDRAELVNIIGSRHTLDAVSLQSVQQNSADVFSLLVDQQSAMLAANDFYALSTILVILSAALVWLARRPSGSLEQGTGH